MDAQARDQLAHDRAKVARLEARRGRLGAAWARRGLDGGLGVGDGEREKQ